MSEKFNLGNYMQEYTINEEQLKELKAIGVTMLQDFHDICVANDIFYSLAFGTLLGAVRHKGYIPWDDDIDIYMYKKDYEKFCEIVRTQYSDDYYVLDNKVDKKYSLFFPKLIKKNTLLVEAINDGKYDIGCYIDIFLLDNPPKRCLKLKQKMYLLCRLFATASNIFKYPSKCICKIAKKNRAVRWYYRIRRFIGFFASIFSFRAWERLSLFAIRGKRDTSKIASTGLFLKYYDTKLFEEVKLYDFEGHKFYGLADSDKYLTAEYGSDYMTPPPVDKRISHALVKMDLNCGADNNNEMVEDK